MTVRAAGPCGNTLTYATSSPIGDGPGNHVRARLVGGARCLAKSDVPGQGAIA